MKTLGRLKKRTVHAEAQEAQPITLELDQDSGDFKLDESSPNDLSPSDLLAQSVSDEGRSARSQTAPEVHIEFGVGEFDQPQPKTRRASSTQLPAAPVSRIEDLIEEASRYAEQARSPQTKRAYKSDWDDFILWNLRHNLPPLPSHPTYVALYLTERAKTLKVSTLRRRLTAITQAHKLKGYDLDTKHMAIRNVWSGIRREIGVAQEGKSPLRVEELRLIAITRPDTLKGIRDRALIMLGFAGAFRRSELVGLNFNDLEFLPQGLKVTVRRSKTDQEGEGMFKAMPYGRHDETCSVHAVQRWIQVSQIQSGPLFRPINRHAQMRPRRLTGHAVATILKDCLKDALRCQGWPERLVLERISAFSGHSLRAGYVTSAAAEGVEEHTIMRQTGHKRVDTLRRYIREGDLFRDHPLARMDL